MAWETRIAAPHRSDSKISRLNDDILALIFTLNTEFDFDTPHIPSTTTRYTSQVSARWRKLTLNFPMLWASSLDFTGKISWIQMVLDRAKNYPLNVSYPALSSQILSNQFALSAWRHLEQEQRMSLVHGASHGPFDIEKLDLALSLFSRCRRFRLILFDFEEWKHARDKFVSPAAPYLEEMTVLVKVDDLQYCPLDPPATESSIFDLAISPKSKLKTFHRLGYGFKPFTAFECKTLTTLIIHGMEDKGSVLAVNEWLAILSCFPQIEVLDLTDCFKMTNRHLGHNDTKEQVLCPTLSLCKLRSIKLEGVWDKVSMMLSQIKFPATSAMNLGFRNVEPEDPNSSLVSDTLSLVQERVQDFIDSQKVVDLSLFFRRYPGLGWKLWNNLHRGDDKPLCITWIPECDDTGDETLYFQSLKQILDIMSPTLTSLYFDTVKIGDHESAYDHKIGLFRTFQNVESLCIPSTGTLKYVWMQIKDDHAAGRNPTQILPALQLVILGSTNITKKGKGRVCDIFRIRSESGAPIAKCLVKNCEGSALKQLIGDLRDLGVQVEWDGKIGGQKEEIQQEEGSADEDHDDNPKTELGHLTIQAKWDGSYKDDCDDVWDSDHFNSDNWDNDDDDGDDDEDED